MTELRARERSLVWIRWIGVAFAIAQVTIDQPAARPIGYVLAAILATANLLIAWGNGRTHSLPAQQALGLGALALDGAILLGFTYLYAFEQYGSTWLILYLVPLEAALRYGLPGTIVTAAAISLLYVPREVYRQLTFGYTIEVSSITFRLGILWIVALFAGFIARQLQRERDAARQLAISSCRLAAVCRPDRLNRRKTEACPSCHREPVEGKPAIKCQRRLDRKAATWCRAVWSRREQSHQPRSPGLPAPRHPQ